MQFLYGVLSAVSFFVCLYLAYALGKRSKRPLASAQKEVSEQERRRAERLAKGFNELMSYDVTQALKGKKVT